MSKKVRSGQFFFNLPVMYKIKYPTVTSSILQCFTVIRPTPCYRSENRSFYIQNSVGKPNTIMLACSFGFQLLHFLYKRQILQTNPVLYVCITLSKHCRTRSFKIDVSVSSDKFPTSLALRNLLHLRQKPIYTRSSYVDLNKCMIKYMLMLNADRQYCRQLPLGLLCNSIVLHQATHRYNHLLYLALF